MQTSLVYIDVKPSSFIVKRLSCTGGLDWTGLYDCLGLSERGQIVMVPLFLCTRSFEHRLSRHIELSRDEREYLSSHTMLSTWEGLQEPVVPNPWPSHPEKRKFGPLSVSCPGTAASHLG